MARASSLLLATLLVTVAAAAPPPARSHAQTAGDPVIAAAGDIACSPYDASYNGGAGTATNCRMRATSDLLVSGGLAGVLTLGDNQYESGELANFNASYAPTWGRVASLTRPAPGNHDYNTPGAAGYYAYFGAAAGDPSKGYYSFDVGSWHLIALNSNCSAIGGCGAGSAQEQWLRSDLAAHSTSCTLAYWHHPRFSSGSHGDDTAYDAFWRALYAAGADLVLAGHDHSYERFAPQTPDGAADPVYGIREFVVGTGGKSHYGFPTVRPNSEVRNGSTYGVLKLTLHQASYEWRFAADVTGAFSDSGTTACHGAPGAPPSDTVPPAAPTVTDPTAPVSVRSNSYTIRGQAEAGSTVRLWLDDGNDGAKDGAAAAYTQQLPAGETSYAIGASLRSRLNDFLVTATDAAGNESGPSDVPTITNTRRRK